jgi:hypothetical protein
MLAYQSGTLIYSNAGLGEMAKVMIICPTADTNNRNRRESLTNGVKDSRGTTGEYDPAPHIGCEAWHNPWVHLHDTIFYYAKIFRLMPSW